MSRKQKHEKRTPPRSVSVSAHVFLPLLIVPVVIAVTSLLPPDSARIWGVNSGAWLPPRLWLPVVALPLLLLLPAVRRWIASIPLLSAERKRKGSISPPYVVLGLAALLLAAMLLWSVPYPFLGDGVVYRSEVFRLLNDPDRVSELVKMTSVLTGLLIEFVADVLRPEHTDTPYFVVCLIALAAGTGIAGYLLRGAKPLYQLLLIAPLFLGSGVLLHFTYVELYMLQFTFCALFCLSLFTWKEGRHGLLLPTGLLLLSIGFGLSSIILLPSYAVAALVMWRPNWVQGERMRMLLLGAILLGGIAAILIVHATVPVALRGQFLMSFHPPSLDPAVDTTYSTYTVFSSAHLLDILNLLTLNVGVFLPILATQFFRLGPRRILSDDISFSLLAGTIAAGLQLLFGSSLFALARDWDLMLMPSLLIAYLSIRLILLEAVPGNRRLLAFGSTGILALTTLLWLGINLSGVSARRFESILDADRGLLGPLWLRTGYRTLEQYHGLEGNHADADRVIVTLIDLGSQKLDSYEMYFLHAIRMQPTGKFLQAATWLMDRMARDDAYLLPAEHWRHVDAEALHSKLASIIIETATTSGNEGIVASALQRYAPMLPEWKAAALLRALLATDRPPAERYAMVQDYAFTEMTDPLLYPYRANLAQLAGMCDTAVYYFEEMIARDIHEHPRAYLGLANVHLQCREDTASAVRALERLQRNCKLAGEERAYAQRMLGTLRAVP